MNETELKTADMYQQNEEISEEEINAELTAPKSNGSIACTEDIFWDNVNLAKQFAPLSKELLFKLFENREINRDTIFEHNMKLVLWVAKRYKTFTNASTDIMDLVQEGYLGLTHSIDTFDTARGCAFSTYAYNWVNHYIRRYIETTFRDIRIPSHLLEMESKLKKIENESGEHRDNYTAEELQEMLGCGKLTAQELVDSMITKTTCTLEQQTDGEEDTCLAETIAQTTFETPEKALERKETIAELKKKICKLPTRQRDAVLVYWDLISETDKVTNTLVAERLGTTIQGARDLLKKAFSKLRDDLEKSA